MLKFADQIEDGKELELYVKFADQIEDGEELELYVKFADQIEDGEEFGLEVIVGNDYSGELITGDVSKRPGPITMNSKFGWLISGPGLILVLELGDWVLI